MSFVKANYLCFLRQGMTRMFSFWNKKCFGTGIGRTLSVSSQAAKENTLLLAVIAWT